MSMSLFQEKLSFQKWKINKLADNNTYLEINLKNLASNLDFLRSKIKSTTKLLAVTKANGYGSDSIEVSKFLENKVDYFAVAYTSEGVELRKNKIKSLTPQRAFYLENNTAQRIPLRIPGIMNPNLSPFSRSGVDLKNGQKIYLDFNGKRILILEVTDSIKHGDRIDIATLINKAINN